MRTTIRNLAPCLALAAAALCAQPRAAGAVAIGFQPPALAVVVGESFAVDLVVSGLGPAGSPPALGGFDVTVAFDDVALDFVSASFGTLLGDPSLFEAITGDAPVAGGRVLAEVSLLDEAVLVANQPDAFTLATLTFKAAVAGTTALSIGSALLSDEEGGLLRADSLGAARIDAVVPEPTGALLFALGAAIVGAGLSGGGSRHGRP